MEIIVRGTPDELLTARKLVEALAAVTGADETTPQGRPEDLIPADQVEFVTAKAARTEWRELVLRFVAAQYEAGATLRIGESTARDTGTTNYLRAHMRGHTFAFVRPYTPLVRFLLDAEDIPADLGLTRYEARGGRGRSSKDNAWITLRSEEALAEALTLAELARDKAAPAAAA
jgi:hypothetical protein